MTLEDWRVEHPVDLPMAREMLSGQCRIQDRSLREKYAERGGVEVERIEYELMLNLYDLKYEAEQ